MPGSTMREWSASSEHGLEGYIEPSTPGGDLANLACSGAGGTGHDVPWRTCGPRASEGRLACHRLLGPRRSARLRRSAIDAGSGKQLEPQEQLPLSVYIAALGLQLGSKTVHLRGSRVELSVEPAEPRPGSRPQGSAALREGERAVRRAHGAESEGAHPRHRAGVRREGGHGEGLALACPQIPKGGGTIESAAASRTAPPAAGRFRCPVVSMSHGSPDSGRRARSGGATPMPSEN